MKFLVVSAFLYVLLVFVESFPLEEDAEYAVLNDGVEIYRNGDELMPLIRNKRQYSFNLPPPPPPRTIGGNWMGGGSALGLGVPRNSFNIPPPPPPPKFSGNWMGGGSALGVQANYDVPRGGASVMGIHDFAHGGSRAGVEGRVNLLRDRTQSLSLSAGHSTNIGPGPKMPENSVGVVYRKSFG